MAVSDIRYKPAVVRSIFLRLRPEAGKNTAKTREKMASHKEVQEESEVQEGPAEREE